MLLVFDIGNTNICVGAYRDEELVFEFRLKTDPMRTIDEYVGLLDSLFARRLGGEAHFTSAIIASVVPPATLDLAKVAREFCGTDPLIVGPGIKTGLPLHVQEPQAVGADRVVNAVAARALFGSPAIVVDFGTATTFDLIGADGAYEGGVIAAGLHVALESLVRHTAKLPRIEINWPKSVIGKTTVSAMQAGAVVGYVSMVDGLIDRMIAEAGAVEHVVATGGLGRLITQHSARIREYDPHLTLKGLRLLSEMNA